MTSLGPLSSKELQDQVIAVISDVIRDWDLDPDFVLTQETGLIGDLDFESIDIVRLVVAIEQHFQVKGIPFESLFMKDGGYINELRISEIVDFLGQYTSI